MIIPAIICGRHQLAAGTGILQEIRSVVDCLASQARSQDQWIQSISVHMPCDRGSCGDILGDIASAKISQASQDELDKLNGQYVHAKRGIGNLHIL